MDNSRIQRIQFLIFFLFLCNAAHGQSRTWNSISIIPDSGRGQPPGSLTTNLYTILADTNTQGLIYYVLRGGYGSPGNVLTTDGIGHWYPSAPSGGIATIYGVSPIVIHGGDTVTVGTVPFADSAGHADSSNSANIASVADTALHLPPYVSTFHTSLSGLTPSSATSGAITLAGTLGTANGGTGESSLGQMLLDIFGDSTSRPGYALTTKAGGGWTYGSIAGGGSGTVTSVDVSGGSTGLTTSGGPITISGTITLGGTLGISNGGTGHSTAESAFDALSGLTTKGDMNYYNVGPQRLGIGTTGQVLTVSSGLPIWANATAGTVTSIALAAPAEFTVSGSPITTSGTLTLSKANETANTVYAGPTSGSAAAPGFRALVEADIPGTLGSYIWNQDTGIQAGANFSIAGNGYIGEALTARIALISYATFFPLWTTTSSTQYNIFGTNNSDELLPISALSGQILINPGGGDVWEPTNLTQGQAFSVNHYTQGNYTIPTPTLLATQITEVYPEQRPTIITLPAHVVGAELYIFISTGAPNPVVINCAGADIFANNTNTMTIQALAAGVRLTGWSRGWAVTTLP